MARRKLVSEVLEEAGKILKRDERIKFLQLNKSPGLTDILRVQYDDTIVSALPEGAPNYRQDDAPKDYQYTILNKAYTQFKYFFKGPIANDMNPLKRESLFLNLLETLHVEEAELLIAAKDKKMKYKGITKKLVRDAFPNLIVK